jgi:hypothetical protein
MPFSIRVGLLSPAWFASACAWPTMPAHRVCAPKNQPLVSRSMALLQRQIIPGAAA